jgi:3-aminobutyryl-CoA ammonia-lyase
VNERVLLRLRVGAEQAHYGGGLVDGAFVLKLFGDAATELLIRLDGDEGLFRAYGSVDFLAPVHGGDYLEIEAEITQVGKTSRQMRFEARRVIAPAATAGGSTTSSARVLDPPEVVARATGTCVVPSAKQKTQKVDRPQVEP